MFSFRTLLIRTSRCYSRLAVNPQQEASMNETCILTDPQDKAIGKASKRQCHLLDSNGDLLLHRAFSVFIFNSKNELLLQKRASTKVTYPGYVTNSCCSHPLYDFAEETNEKNALGVKLAARRRLEIELGIPKSLVDLDNIEYMTRILYKDLGDGVWGEHELDYILIMSGQDLPLRPNPEEVSDIVYLKRSNFEKFLSTSKDPLTPWFSLIAKTQLAIWWDNLHQLDQLQDHNKIWDFTK